MLILTRLCVTGRLLCLAGDGLLGAGAAPTRKVRTKAVAISVEGTLCIGVSLPEEILSNSKSDVFGVDAVDLSVVWRSARLRRRARRADSVAAERFRRWRDPQSRPRRPASCCR